MTRLPRPRRSVLYVPAANTKAMDKTPTLGCDAIIFDLEDAVAPAAKTDARQALKAHFDAHPTSPKERVIRINGLTTAWGADDLAAAIACRPDALLLPKVDSADQLLGARAMLEAAGRPEIGLWAMIETPLGIVNIAKIAQLGRNDHVRLECLVVGSNDIARETGLPVAGSRPTIRFWLANLVIHARAYGVSIVDGVYNDFRDSEGFASECADGSQLGFDGKSLIHPLQIDPANTAFSPSAAALADARAIVEAFAAPHNAGQGILSINGKMVELLHLEMAKAVIAKAGTAPL